jgi:hypothetical protein
MILYCYQKEKKMRMFYLQTTSQHKYFTGYKQFLDKGLPIGVIVIQKQIESSKQAEEITVAF